MRLQMKKDQWDLTPGRRELDTVWKDRAERSTHLHTAKPAQDEPASSWKYELKNVWNLPFWFILSASHHLLARTWRCRKIPDLPLAHQVPLLVIFHMIFNMKGNNFQTVAWMDGSSAIILPNPGLSGPFTGDYLVKKTSEMRWWIQLLKLFRWWNNLHVLGLLIILSPIRMILR